MPASHQTLRLSAGRHRSPDDGVCVMELASMLADEPFTDRPRSVSPSLASVLRGYNDGLDDARRQTLKRFAAASVGTISTRRAEKERRRLVQAWLAEGAVGGLRAKVGRYLDAADPYSVIRNVGKRVVARDDDVLHARMLALLDTLVAVGAEAGRPPLTAPDAVLPAPASDPCAHHCPTFPGAGGSEHDHRV